MLYMIPLSAVTLLVKLLSVVLDDDKCSRVRNEPTVRSSMKEVRFDIEHLLEIEGFAKFRSVSFVVAAENRLPLVSKFVMW